MAKQIKVVVGGTPEGAGERDDRSPAQIETDWNLIVSWCHYTSSHTDDPRWGRVVTIAQSLQDGYGAPGAGPGDWSGIRDSSGAAQARIAAAIRAELAKTN